MEGLLADISEVDRVVAIDSLYSERGQGQISRDGDIAFATVHFRVIEDEAVPPEIGTEIVNLAGDVQLDGLTVEPGGSVIQFSEFEEPGGAEGIGILFAIVILLITFGSVLAMGMPIASALFGIGIGLSLVMLLANFLNVPNFTPRLAMMIGIGVGIDYALFSVTRYRQQLHHGLDPEQATMVAITTSGKAVLFAGSTVVISLLGILLMGFAFVEGLAIGGAATVAVTMIAAVTLLPALLGFADASAGSTERSSRRAYDLLSEGFGPGFNGPLLLATPVDSDQDVAELGELNELLSETDGIAAVTQPFVNEAGDAAVMTAFPMTAPQDEATTKLVERLRADVIPQVDNGNPIYIGGFTAGIVDFSEAKADRLPKLLMVVIGLSFLLLVAVFRSIVVPLKAAIMNLLSIGAAYGAVVAIFQWGWLKEVVGVENSGPIEAWVPMMLFTILFGLSMDYEIFLLSRIREEYVRTGDNGLAVANGLAATARVITAAAAIMVTLFMVFVLGFDERAIKLFAVGLAVAIFVDATV